MAHPKKIDNKSMLNGPYLLNYITDIQILVIWLVELYFTWHSLLLPFAPAFKKTYSPLGNSISHSTVRIILVSNVCQQYSAAAPLLKQRSNCAKGCDPICLLPLRSAIWFWLSVTCVMFHLCDLKYIKWQEMSVIYKTKYLVALIRGIGGILSLGKWNSPNFTLR